ncbi:MAG TPA: hypothetical protein VFS58_08700 [Steroidobacteraceae bacterium]|nr:hypothetical protein [Steroidobacteraceae bacterium]
MISPLERARLLDAEMRLQRAWLELSLRELSGAARASPWAGIGAFKVGKLGLSFLKHRSIWLAAVSLLVNLYRRHTHKAK